jgi:cobalt-zinc-cadmium efflux system outer membrane protein
VCIAADQMNSLRRQNREIRSQFRSIAARGRCQVGIASVVGVLVLGVLTGCAAYQAAPLEPRHSADQFAARRLDDAQLRDDLMRLMPEAAASWPPQQWDRGELLAVALVRNPGLAVAQAQVRAALAHQITAAETPNPVLTLQSEYAAHQEMHPWLYGISIDWLLRSPGRRRLEREIARLDTTNMRLQFMDQTWALRHSLTAALSDWDGSRRRLVLLEQLATAQDRLLVLERKRVQAGEDSPAELVTAEQARIEIEQQQAQLRAEVDTAQVAAAKTMGFPPNTLDGMMFTWPDWGVPPPVSEEKRTQAREQALLSRNDLGAAIGDYAIAETQLKLAVARQYPQFNLGPGYYWDHGIAKFPFDVSFTLPVNRNRGEIAEARAARDLAGKRMLALQADIYGEVASAERAERLARASTDAAERQLETARRQVERSNLSLRIGASDVQEQLAAQIVALRAELEVLQMRAQLQSARNTLEDVLHAPLSGPELALTKSADTLLPGAGS